MLRVHASKGSLRKHASVEATQRGMCTGGGELIKPLAKYGLGGNGFYTESIGEKFIAPIKIDVIKIVSTITEQSDLGEKDVSITDCVASSGLKVFRKLPLGVVFEKQSAKMIPCCGVEFRVAASQFIVFDFLTCWVWF